MTTPSLPLNNGTSIPQIGLGTSPLTDKEVERTIVVATELGYRHIDTAARYGNETGVGAGIRSSGLPREEFFVTTKLDGPYQGDDRAVAGLDGSLERLGLDYVDLLLIHWPLPARDQYVSTWKTFERLLAAGKTRAIGVSNFKPAHLERLLAETDVAPAVNQIQLNPGVPRAEQREYDSAHGIVTESWSPLGAGNDLLASPVLARIGAQYGKTPGQVVLRWHVELGLVAIPKSATPARLAENLDVFDFALSPDDLRAIEDLSVGAAPGVDSDRTGH
ncbi:MAG: 2,5-diketo-D-gluconate reductase [Microbacteriaceae bacterium]|nr:2,5-diketo-D-gluconate reductase [Microbacteriaceae bacterium]